MDTALSEPHTNHSEDEDPLAPARGFLFALALSIPFWVMVGVIIWMVVS